MKNTSNTTFDITLFNNTLIFAAIAHKEQKRKADNSPYINHLIEVADLLTRVSGVTKVDILQAAILHDILEDTSTAKEELQQYFRKNIANLVIELTDDTSLNLKEKREKQLSHIQSSSIEVKLIKLADHTSNIAAIPNEWSFKRTTEYLAWSLVVATACAEASPKLFDEYKRRYSFIGKTIMQKIGE